jgi:hypothetical protein
MRSQGRLGKPLTPESKSGYLKVPRAFFRDRGARSTRQSLPTALQNRGCSTCSRGVRPRRFRNAVPRRPSLTARPHPATVRAVHSRPRPLHPHRPRPATYRALRLLATPHRDDSLTGLLTPPPPSSAAADHRTPGNTAEPSCQRQEHLLNRRPGMRSQRHALAASEARDGDPGQRQGLTRSRRGACAGCARGGGGPRLRVVRRRACAGGRRGRSVRGRAPDRPCRSVRRVRLVGRQDRGRGG